MTARPTEPAASPTTSRGDGRQRHAPSRRAAPLRRRSHRRAAHGSGAGVRRGSQHGLRFLPRPAAIPSLLEALEQADIVIGSRYVEGGRLEPGRATAGCSARAPMPSYGRCSTFPCATALGLSRVSPGCRGLHPLVELHSEGYSVWSSSCTGPCARAGSRGECRFSSPSAARARARWACARLSGARSTCFGCGCACSGLRRPGRGSLADDETKPTHEAGDLGPRQLALGARSSNS